MNKKNFYLVNIITGYRIVAAPMLVALVLYDYKEAFGWLLALSFFTDLADGFLARRFKVSSIFGARFDSLADDLTFLAAIAGMLVFKLDFLIDNLFLIAPLIGLYLLQLALSLIRYKKISSFHTYLAKISMLVSGSFLILLFLLKEPLMPLFYVAVAFTAFDLLEEILLVLMINTWKANVKGIYWVLRGNSGTL